MITQYRPSCYQSPRASSFAGCSVDNKPLDVENGSTFKEIDTGRVFRYDKENNIWIEWKGATPVQPAKPEQAKTVDLNMATGNQTVLPDEGKVLSSVVVTKPTTLVAENIKKDVNIGGVIGTLEGGAGATEPYIEEIYDAYGNLIDAKMYGYTKVRDYAFYYCKDLALTSLPESLTSIGNSAFYYCRSLAFTSLPEGLTSIGNSAFAGCTSLTSITFKGTPTSIRYSAFDGCTNLTSIKVPWAEGAVANAPWGATNATITYNYTE